MGKLRESACTHGSCIQWFFDWMVFKKSWHNLVHFCRYQCFIERLLVLRRRKCNNNNDAQLNYNWFRSTKFLFGFEVQYIFVGRFKKAILLFCFVKLSSDAAVNRFRDSFFFFFLFFCTYALLLFIIVSRITSRLLRLYRRTRVPADRDLIWKYQNTV